jgi:hypothetical protein
MFLYTVNVNNKAPPAQSMEICCVITANFLDDDRELVETLAKNKAINIIYIYLYIYIYIYISVVCTMIILLSIM